MWHSTVNATDVTFSKGREHQITPADESSSVDGRLLRAYGRICQPARLCRTCLEGRAGSRVHAGGICRNSGGVSHWKSGCWTTGEETGGTRHGDGIDLGGDTKNVMRHSQWHPCLLTRVSDSLGVVVGHSSGSGAINRVHAEILGFWLLRRKHVQNFTIALKIMCSAH